MSLRISQPAVWILSSAICLGIPIYLYMIAWSVAVSSSIQDTHEEHVREFLKMMPWFIATPHAAKLYALAGAALSVIAAVPGFWSSHRWTTAALVVEIVFGGLLTLWLLLTMVL